MISKRRLASLATASAMIATMVVASAPAAAFAADAASCQPTGFIRDGINLTAAQIGGTVTGPLDATNCNIGVYNPTSVSGATIFGADYFGVVVNGAAANVNNSTVRNIGNVPFDGTQHGRAILYINGASGTISGNKVFAFQKNGIEVSSLTPEDRNTTNQSAVKTAVTVQKNVVTGEGPIPYIAQNGIVIRSGANATVVKNTVSRFHYTTAGTEATGLLLYEAGRVNVQNNNISDNDEDIYDAGFTGGHVKP